MSHLAGAFGARQGDLWIIMNTLPKGLAGRIQRLGAFLQKAEELNFASAEEVPVLTATLSGRITDQSRFKHIFSVRVQEDRPELSTGRQGCKQDEGGILSGTNFQM